MQPRLQAQLQVPADCRAQALGIIDRRRLHCWHCGQWNEFGIARHMPEPPVAPILFRLLDALAGTGDKVPPDMSRAIQCGTPEQQQLHRSECHDGDRLAWTKHDQLTGIEAVTVDVDTGHTRGLPDFVTNLLERGKSLLALARGEKAHG